jgi:hypothetical protein
MRDLHGITTRPASIYDRHPLVSEPIYAPMVRGVEPQTPFDDAEWLASARKDMAEHAVLVVCLPPAWVLRSNVQRTVQMPGVVDNIGELWRVYSHPLHLWPAHVIMYDYTNHDTKAMKLLEIQSAIRGGLRV